MSDPSSGPRGRIAGDTAGVMAAEFASITLRYVGSVFMTRALGIAWFGSVTLGVTVTSLLGTVALLGVSPGVLPFLARARRGGRPDDVRAVVRSAWLLVGASGLVVGALAAACAPWIADVLFRKPELAEIFRTLSVIVVLSSFTVASTCLIQGFMGVRRQAFIERVIVPGVTTAGLVLTWWLEAGVRGVLLATIAGAAAGCVAAIAVVRGIAPGALDPREKSAALCVGPLARESWPLMGVSMSSFILMWMDALLVGALCGNDEVGTYGACARLAPAVVLVLNAAGPVFLARLSASFADQDWETIGRLYKTTGRWSLWSGAVVAAILIVWGRPLLAIFGPEFVGGTTALTLLALGRAASASGGMCGRMLSITGKARLNLTNMLVMVTCNGVMDLLLIPRLGAAGAALATCVSIVTVNALQTAQVWSIYRVHPFSRSSAGGLVGVAALALASAGWRSGPDALGPYAWLLPLGVFVAACAAAYAFFAADDEERAFLGRLRRGLWS